mmetsp:Transcript_16885/g.34892  ORF Transcript_16885/g.34892 Transcript_16885/m.34892 type:complete len:230 (+) Transcript_16885:2611-3300(+)
MDFRTRSTRSRGSHFPKVILGIKGQHTRFRQVLQPQLSCFFVRRSLFISGKVGGIQSFLIEFEFFRQTFPRHFNGALLEVIAKGPIAQHFKKGMMIDILAHIIQIIVFATGANAFLRVDGTFQFGHFQIRIASAQKEWFVLIHTRIGKEQGGIIDGDTRTAGPKDMSMLFDKKVNKGLTNLGHGPFQFLLVVAHDGKCCALFLLFSFRSIVSMFCLFQSFHSTRFGSIT